MIENKEAGNLKIKEVIHNINVSIGDLIRGKRKALNISIVKLASLFHVSTTVITDLENARSLPKLEALMKLAAVLGIPFDVLFEKFKQGSSVSINSPRRKQTLEVMIKALGLGNIEKKEVFEFIEFKKYLNSKRK